MPAPLEYQPPQPPTEEDYGRRDLAWAGLLMSVFSPAVCCVLMASDAPTGSMILMLVFSATGTAVSSVAIRRIIRDDYRRRGLAVAIMGVVIGAGWFLLVLAGLIVLIFNS
jgi:MFS family permease